MLCDILNTILIQKWWKIDDNFRIYLYTLSQIKPEALGAVYIYEGRRDVYKQMIIFSPHKTSRTDCFSPLGGARAFVCGSSKTMSFLGFWLVVSPWSKTNLTVIMLFICYFVYLFIFMKPDTFESYNFVFKKKNVGLKERTNFGTVQTYRMWLQWEARESCLLFAPQEDTWPEVNWHGAEPWGIINVLFQGG